MKQYETLTVYWCGLSKHWHLDSCRHVEFKQDTGQRARINKRWHAKTTTMYRTVLGDNVGVSTFKCLKVGQRVYDTWFGVGTVLAKTQRRCLIKLRGQDKPWKYDTDHVNAFIVTKRPEPKAKR